MDDIPAQRPSFDDLPLRKDGPRGNAWGLFGPDDQCGMLNLLKPEVTATAARENIISGVRVTTDLPLNRMAAPCFGRAPFQHSIKNKAPRSVNDDTIVLNTQIASQWDGFRHYGFQNEALYFGGKTLEDLLNSDVIGVHAWVKNGGIVGRGVLLDYAAWCDQNGVPVEPFTTTSIPAATLQKVASSQGTSLRRGDILLVRSGWLRGFEQLTDAQRADLAAIQNPPAIGLESSEATLRWAWDQGFAAVGGDQPSLEAWPCQNKDFWLHEWFLAGWGLPIGELFDLERLSEECRRQKRWTFFFSSIPLNVPGGVASPPNGVAIF